MKPRAFVIAVAIVGLARAGFAQDAAAGSPPEDPMAAPTEYGIRLTPAMVRPITQMITRNWLVRGHELDESKADQVSELMARRIMQFAHQNDETAQDLVEFCITEMFDNSARNGGRGMIDGIPETLARGIGTRLAPAMPAIRELANNIMRDVRPELGLKQQIKLTAEITAMNVAVDVFDKNMQAWAKGDVDPFVSPFEDKEAPFKKDENGETQALRQARTTAEARAKAKPGGEWEKYVREAKEYYELDASQAAAADSLLRDYQERANVAIGNPDEWRAGLYRHGLLRHLTNRLSGGRGLSPLAVLLQRDEDKIVEPLNALGDDLKRRIEDIPTQAQRDAAEARMRAALTEKGLNLDEPTETAPASEPAAEVDK